MKICGKCKQERDLSLFRKRAKGKDGLSVWCKPCYADYERERYQNGDRERKERNKAKIVARNRKHVWAILTSSSCVDCGNNDPEVLEFDHRDAALKSANVSEMWLGSLDLIIAEIEKCDIRCANCHRKRTIRQFNTWRFTGVG